MNMYLYVYLELATLIARRRSSAIAKTGNEVSCSCCMSSQTVADHRTLRD